MINLADYSDPFQAILDFEQKLCEYTGAPYCVTTDCCTHAIELAFRLAHNKSQVQFPAKTYISVLMTMHKVGVPYSLVDIKWRDQYEFRGSNIWDCARYLAPDMYVPGTIQCLSFNRGKPLQIGRGGCVLTDNEALYKSVSRARSDGRDLFAFSPWQTQQVFDVGYHYTLRPEECVRGLNLLNNNTFVQQHDKDFDYPDCREIVIRE